MWAAHNDQTQQVKANLRYFMDEIWALAQTVTISAYSGFSSGYICHKFPQDQALFSPSYYIPRSKHWSCPPLLGHVCQSPSQWIHTVQRHPILGILDIQHWVYFWISVETWGTARQISAVILNIYTSAGLNVLLPASPCFNAKGISVENHVFTWKHICSNSGQFQKW